MQWTEIAIHTTHEAVEAVSYILEQAGASGVVIEDATDLTKEREDMYGEMYALDANDFPAEGVIVKAYLSEDKATAENFAQIKAAVTNLTSFGLAIGKNEVTITEVHEEDWANAWKQYYHPVRISERFTVVPSWEVYEKQQDNELIIELDPGMAFGTGTHPTTVLCLQSLEKYLQPNEEVVDIGTGSGVLSIGAALLGAKTVHALDLDEVAVRSARENIALNKVDHLIEVHHGNLLDTVEKPADVVVANILADIILSFTDDAFKVVKPGGLYITSGIIGAKRAEVEQGLVNSGFELVETMEMEDWVAITARKPE